MIVKYQIGKYIRHNSTIQDQREQGVQARSVSVGRIVQDYVDNLCGL